MEKIVISGQYKGETRAFNHGENYLIAVSQQADGCVTVISLKTSGSSYFFQDPQEQYETMISFLSHWDEITSFPSLVVSEQRKL